MKLQQLIFFLPFFILSCGTPTNNEKINSVTHIDPFREVVLKMRSVGLIKNISDTKLDSLISIYKTDSVNGLKELLVASGDLLKIHVRLNGRKLEQVYQNICDTIGAKYPQLKCDEVQTSIIPSAAGLKDTDCVLIRFRFGNTWYERQLYYSKNWEVDDFVYRLFNRMLADSGNKLRLHLVKFTCTDCAKKQDRYMGSTDVSKYGYIMLNKMQEDSLLTIDGLQMEPEHEFSLFTSQEVDAQLKKFEATGLVQSIGEKWYSKVKMDIHQSSIYNMQNMYEYMDTLFAQAQFDTMNDYNPYQEILQNLSRVSRGKFIPDQILDDITTSSSHKVRFTFKGDGYEFDAEQKSGLYFTGIIDDVNKALDDQKVKGAFYTVNTRDQMCTLIYIDDDKIEKVKASGFFPEINKGLPKEMKDRYAMAPTQ